MSNPYLDEFEELQETNSFRGQQWFGQRQRLVEEYSWAVPNEEVLAYLSEFDSLYEAGAGSGYWAHLLEERGVDVTPVDIDPPSNTWTEVHEKKFQELEEEVVEEPVLIVWPPLKGALSSDVAKNSPSHILYVGEIGGCTGDELFFELLEEKYGLVAKIEIPSYAGIYDDFYHYVRKI